MVFNRDCINEKTGKYKPGKIIMLNVLWAIRNPLIILFLLLLCSVGNILHAEELIRFGRETLLPDDPRAHYSRAVNFAPGDGEICALNPPRFRWQYHPTNPGEGGDYVFTFQISSKPDFSELIINVQTEFNFYNTIPPFHENGPYYWRIGYRNRLEEDSPMSWSQIRSFQLSPEAEVWDRSQMAHPDFASKGHPRILFNVNTITSLQQIVHTHPDSRIIFNRIQRDADRALTTDWWKNFPEEDKEVCVVPYLDMARNLVQVAFCWRITGDPKYAGVLQRAILMARYPKEGRASPEGAGGESNEDSTQITEFLGLLYDWLYPDLSEEERNDFVHSLDWRIDHFVNHFAWRRPYNGHLIVRSGSLSTIAASHSYEGFFDTFTAALAAYEDSSHARECFHLGLNYMIGVGSSHGFDEGWNEGPGYGNSKFAWYVNAISYLDSIFPEFNMGKNPWLLRMGEYFRAITPVGLKHAPWGHGSNRQSYYENGHVRSYRKLAYLTGDGRFLANFLQYGNVNQRLSRPWIECSLPVWQQMPEPELKEQSVRVFPRSGWITALSGSPSDPNTYLKGVGMIFACRPRGGYSHSFCSDNSFHLFGYGEDLSHAAGTSDYEPHSYHSMSHNTILVDGLGQAQLRGLQKSPFYGRIHAFAKKDGAVYWCGDASRCYPHERFRPREWWGQLADIYLKQDLSYVTKVHRHVLFMRNKYFVILDDLAADRPAQWTWLYHILHSDQMELDENTGSFEYRIGNVNMRGVHLLGTGQLQVLNLRGKNGFQNPITREDYADDRGRARGERNMIAEHNLWITTREKHCNWRFLSVLYPTPSETESPVIEKIDDLTIRIQMDDETDVITFNPNRANQANVVIDLSAISTGRKQEN